MNCWEAKQEEDV